MINKHDLIKKTFFLEMNLKDIAIKVSYSMNCAS